MVELDSQAIEYTRQVFDTATVRQEKSHFRQHSKDYLELVVDLAWYKQVEILDSIRDNTITLIKSCNDIGKTLAIAIAILWILDCWRPYSKCITTARNFSALQYMLWARIRSVYNKLSYRFNDANIDFLSFKPDPKNHPEWFAVGYNPAITGDEAEAFQGHHAPPAPPGEESLCVFFIDEAITTPPGVLKAVEGSLFSEGTKLVAVYNPTDKSSPISQYENDPRTNLIHISQDDFFNSPEFQAHPELFKELASPERTKAFVELYGENSPIVMVRVKGEYPDEDENTPIKYSDCIKAQDLYNDYDPEVEKDDKYEGFKVGEVKKIIYSWDVAGEGSDLNVLRRLICGDKGLMYKKLRAWHSSHQESLLYVNEQLGATLQSSDAKLEDEIPEIHLVVDAIGEGSHVPSIMSEWQPNVVMTAFKAGEKAGTVSERPDIIFLNKISEAWYRTSLVLSGGIYLPIAMELDSDTINQLSTRKKKWGKKLNEPQTWWILPKEDWKKENRGKSPDDADAIVMGIWDYFSSQPVRFFSV